ncbi:ribonuclease HI [Microdochium nivale]|nr:ribonuclease HI [Microdochium nivale]
MNPHWNSADLQRMLLANTISPPRCALASCASTAGLMRCSGCKVVSYCSTAHQAVHRRPHKADCNKIKNLRTKLDAAEVALRARAPDFDLPPDVFNSAVGRFWGLPGTRDYMLARHNAMEALLRVDTCDAVESALDHALAMLRLCRSDNLGVRQSVPFLMLRLGREQDCYDFIKWWADTSANPRYDWADMSAPYLDVHGANPLEPLTTVLLDHLDLDHATALTLLKARMLIDISEYENDDGFPADPTLDRRIGQVISERVCRRDSVSVQAISDRLAQQFSALCKKIQAMNPYFWETLLNDADISPPAYSAMGSPEEAALACIHGKRAWEESEDTLQMVDAEVAKYTTVYRPRPVPRTIFPAPPAQVAEKQHATGTVFPTLFRFPLATPQQLFKHTSIDGFGLYRFVSRSDATQALVFVDGACADNGQQNPSGGWAVVNNPSFCTSLAGHSSQASVISARLEDTGPFGASSIATSNRAELRASIAALRECNWVGEGFRSLVIATDSSYVVDGATRWSKTWLANGWKLQSGETVKNQDLWDLLLGQIEAAKESGLAVEFWKIARELNTEADQAAKAASTRTQAIADFTDTASAATTRRPKVLALLIDSEQLFNDIHANLISSIASKTTFERVSSCEAALEELSCAPLSTVILVADAAITHRQALREAVLDRLHAGATVILAGQFSTSVAPGQFDRLMGHLGLPWKRGSYERTNLRLRRSAAGDAGASGRLPVTYSAKAVYLEKVAAPGVWYTHEHDPRQAAVALARVGQGRLGYMGDVNGETHSNQVVLALCGLL